MSREYDKLYEDGTDLIDTQWNVNIDTTYKIHNFLADLIDTQWNVNPAPMRQGTTEQEDLIDTQWNVNNVFNIPFAIASPI